MSIARPPGRVDQSDALADERGGDREAARDAIAGQQVGKSGMDQRELDGERESPLESPRTHNAIIAATAIRSSRARAPSRIAIGPQAMTMS